MNDELDFSRLEAAIGRLILSCSRVEYEVFRLYEARLPKRDYFSDSYSNRYDKAIGVARAEFTDGERIAEMLVRMKGLSMTRHLVAHNAIHFAPSEVRRATGLDSDFAIFDMRGRAEPMSIRELEAQAAAAYKLSVQLATALRINVSR